MYYKYSITEKIFHFKQPAHTSRGVYDTKSSYFVRLEPADSIMSGKDAETQPGQFFFNGSDSMSGSIASGRICGIGECSVLPNLNCDDVADYADILKKACESVCRTGKLDYVQFAGFPSIIFGLETALAQIGAGGSLDFFDTHFGKGEEGIPINGLIWMGDYRQMLERVDEKLEQGYRCVKLKVGAIDFEKEIALLRHIRSRYSPDEVELRLDANGGLPSDKALDCLKRFSEYGIHSIEQPVPKGNTSLMAKLCESSPIPVALDEELIGISDAKDKCKLLDDISPAYIILKPSLHGGMRGVREWGDLARSRGIGSWMTSALESNVGLNSIAQLAASVYGNGISMPQGLGTGQLFTDNIPLPLVVKNTSLWYDAG